MRTGIASAGRLIYNGRSFRAAHFLCRSSFDAVQGPDCLRQRKSSGQTAGKRSGIDMNLYEMENGAGESRPEVRLPDSGNSFERIYQIVKQIPRGKVASYGQVARLAGNARWSRVVGYALHANPDPEKVPCYRVVTKDGRVSEAFAFGGGNRQVELLQADGVEFEDGHVVMERYQWETPEL